MGFSAFPILKSRGGKYEDENDRIIALKLRNGDKKKKIQLPLNQRVYLAWCNCFAELSNSQVPGQHMSSTTVTLKFKSWHDSSPPVNRPHSSRWNLSKTPRYLMFPSDNEWHRKQLERGGKTWKTTAVDSDVQVDSSCPFLRNSYTINSLRVATTVSKLLVKGRKLSETMTTEWVGFNKIARSSLVFGPSQIFICEESWFFIVTTDLFKQIKNAFY